MLRGAVTQLIDFRDNSLFNGLELGGADLLSLHQLAESLGNAVDARDSHTYDHSQQVAVVGYLLARAMGCSARQADIIHIAGHLHDIGKIGLPDAVLQKEGKLSDGEWALVRKHPEIGARIAAPVKAFSGKEGIAAIIFAHHERFDGGGYPLGLKGGEIPIGARIIAVADALSAMIQDRPYRKGRSLAEAEEEVLAHGGAQFDPIVVAAFAGVRREVRGWLEGKEEETP
ncbi:MAG: HD-GYP domain-containing protein [Thermodesulfobacteriota bacterium]